MSGATCAIFIMTFPLPAHANAYDAAKFHSVWNAIGASKRAEPNAAQSEKFPALGLYLRANVGLRTAAPPSAVRQFPAFEG